MKHSCSFIGILCVNVVFSQGLRDTTIHLKEANVEAAKVTVIDDTKKGLALESDNKGVTEYLKKQESFFIRNYGQGALASISYRGTSAAQNEVYWNGVKINSPFTGQVDGNLLLLDINQYVSFRSSSNTIGARIGMIDEMPKKGVSGTILLRYTSLNSADVNAGVNYAGKHFYTTARGSFVYAKNDFRILDKSSINKKQPHNQILSGNAKATLGYKFNDKHDLSASFWYSHNNRELAPLITQPTSEQTQYDRSIRTLLNYNGNAKNLFFALRTAYLNDILRYQDKATALNAYSQSSVLRNEVLLSDKVDRKTEIEIAVKYDYEQAKSDGFSGKQQRSIAEIRERIYYTPKAITLRLTAYQTIYRVQALPTFDVWLCYEKSDRNMTYTLESSVAKTLRIPSMNDLYWVVGGTGNPNLKPEKGWKGDVSWKTKHKYFETKLTAYGQYTTDYILWSPTTTLTIWSSENLKRVYGCGTEVFATAGKLVPWYEKESDKWFAFVTTSYSLNRMINIDPISANDESANKQLIYVPVHKIYAAVRGGWQGISASVDYTYFSKIYTSTDNSQSLSGYGLMDLHLSYGFNVKGQEITPGFGIYNLLNTQYETMKNRAMPGRYYEVLLRFNLKGRQDG